MVEKETIEGAIEGAIEGGTAAVKKRLTKLLLAIVTNERKRVPEYSEMTGISPKTVERYMKILRDHELIEFTDEASHIGGYILHPKIRHIIQ